MRRVKDERLRWAEAKLNEAQRIAVRYFNSALKVERKADQSPVTIADRAVEEYLRRELSRAFPDDVIVGEEFGASTSKYGTSYWTIDPIDGTRAFTKGLPFWGMLLSRVEEGRPVLGACLYPMLKIFLGVAPKTPPHEHSEGRRRLLPRAATPPALRDSTILHGGLRWWLGTPYERGFCRLMQRCFLERAYGDCYAYLWVLRGRADAKLEYGVKIWDVAPFAALATATGRVMTDFSGRPSFTGPESILAHPSLTRTISRILRSAS